MTAERPIPFTDEMVRAVLAGRKTQTRRPAKLPDWWPREAVSTRFGPGPQFWPLDARGRQVGHVGVPARACRYGVPGERMWVREAWRAHQLYDDTPPRDIPCTAVRWYRAGADDGAPAASRWRPPMFMPRWASRILLEVTGVRLVKVRSISRADAEAEGFEPGVRKGTLNGQEAEIAVLDPVYWFAMVWNGIHGRGAFAADPWVWAVSFRLLESPARATADAHQPRRGEAHGNEERESEGAGARAEENEVAVAPAR